ncbi:MmcQ/YjbR family DNA-binding protein [Caulobacter segnis]|jgi:predicted DNA-binding protein (MmcQ/YjbR family)|uniref:MmcQ/YjbR family DNA-binding protein n=1 Tax=Caulobacter segnis TaxID=88688 RepID=UPI001CBBEA79|nr:MmcQ/YjbR family DNA-binding protein [Caulobacter segnis]UAL11677.1 MmcQ/YjbR family DNA-binding protein [Caulobacter segnis]
MTPEAFDKACLALPGATLSIQWGDDHVFKVGGKMFAVRGEGVTLGGGISFKASDVAFEVLTETGRASPAPYLARAKWLHFADLADLDAGEVSDWVKTAHGLIAAKLTKKVKAELGLA